MIMNKKIRKEKVFLIAEGGINHNGSVEKAKQLISLAKNINSMQLNFKKM